jgi:hypothetical protein
MARKMPIASRKSAQPPTFGAAKAPIRAAKPLVPLKGLAQGMKSPDAKPLRSNPRRGAKVAY